MPDESFIAWTKFQPPPELWERLKPVARQRHPHPTSPAAGEGLCEGRMLWAVQSENRRMVGSSPRMGEAGRG